MKNPQRVGVQRRITIDVIMPNMQLGATQEEEKAEVTRFAHRWEAITLAFGKGLQAVSDALRDDPDITVRSRTGLID